MTNTIIVLVMSVRLFVNIFRWVYSDIISRGKLNLPLSNDENEVVEYLLSMAVLDIPGIAIQSLQVKLHVSQIDSFDVRSVRVVALKYRKQTSYQFISITK